MSTDTISPREVDNKLQLAGRNPHSIHQHPDRRNNREAEAPIAASITRRRAFTGIINRGSASRPPSHNDRPQLPWGAPKLYFHACPFPIRFHYRPQMNINIVHACSDYDNLNRHRFFKFSEAHDQAATFSKCANLLSFITIDLGTADIYP